MLALSLQQTISWFTKERREWLVAVCFAFAAGYGTANGHTTQGAIAHVSDQLGQTKKALVKTQQADGCEYRLVQQTTALAKEPVVVDPSRIPKDNCPPIPKSRQ